MPPRLNLLASFRALALRPKRPAPSWRPPRAMPPIRGFSDSAPPTGPPTGSPPAEQQAPPPPPTTKPEPASTSADTKNSSSPAPPAPEDSDDIAVSLSTLDASKPVGELAEEVRPDIDNAEALRQLEMISYGVMGFDAKEAGHKYGIPALPIADGMHHKHRYHPVLSQITNLLMRDGKKSKAQRDLTMTLNFLRTFPAPRINPARPLLPGSPAAAYLPLDPVTYFTVAIDSVAPLIKVRNVAKLAGGGMSLAIPIPLPVRARRRIAFQWILELINKRPSKGSGRTQLAHRIAEEIVAIVEGRSSLWEKRQLLHRMGTTNRANVAKLTARRRK